MITAASRPQALEAARKTLKLSMHDAAERTGIPLRFVGRAERGPVHDDLIARLARCYGVPLPALMALPAERPPRTPGPTRPQRPNVQLGIEAARREILGDLRPADLARENAQNAARRAGLTGAIRWHGWSGPTLHNPEPSGHWRFVSPDLRWRMDAEESGYWSVTREGLGEVAEGRVTIPSACQMVAAAWVIALCQARIAHLEASR